jgi:hypothetical protein
MSVAYFTEFADVSTDTAQKVAEHVRGIIGAAAPDGGIFHAEGATDNGWWSFDVWGSDEQADRFYRDVLAPALQHANVTPGQPRKLAVYWDTSEMPPPA